MTKEQQLYLAVFNMHQILGHELTAFIILGFDKQFPRENCLLCMANEGRLTHIEAYIVWLQIMEEK